jgi:hypothetical protein
MIDVHSRSTLFALLEEAWRHARQRRLVSFFALVAATAAGGALYFHFGTSSGSVTMRSTVTTPAQRCADRWNQGRIHATGRTLQMLRAHPERFPLAVNNYRGSCIFVFFRRSVHARIAPIMAVGTYLGGATFARRPHPLAGLHLSRGLPRVLRTPNATLDHKGDVSLTTASSSA